MSDIRIIKKRYIFMASVFIGLALLLVLLPERHTLKELKAERLLQEVNDNTRYFTTDDVAEKIIANDAYMQLIDVRTPEDYKNFHLKGAINIPIDSILNKDEDGNYTYEGILNQDLKANVFYSNGTIYSNQVWLLLRRLKYKNNYVMEGGLNKWIETIIKPTKPSATASQKELDRYDFRRAASMYFGGASVTVSAEEDVPAPTPVIKKSASKEEEGGC
ncbi:MAG: rhodanese-like domain-containing protein [Chlorobi bacterium]|nr:rhodanese-like domain-containing protein [Chlorobiota bacterium]